MVFRNDILPAAVALGSTVLLPLARACSCSFRPLCDSIEFSDVVLHGNVLRRTEPEDQFGDVSYEVRVIELFQTEQGVDYPEDITIATPADPGRCGIYLEVGNEYLLDLLRDEGDLRSVGACGATQSWTTLDDDSIATLNDVDSACAIEVVEDPCEGRCPESYECLFYTGDIAVDQYYCSAVCDPSPCDEGEECRLTVVGCSPGSICGNGYVCSPVASDDVEVVQEAIVEDCSSCGDFQDCFAWSSGASGENYCADFCDPSPCAGDDTCSLEDQDGCDTTESPCPPVATCTASLVAANEEVEIDEEAQEDTSSALRLAAGSLTAAIVLVATLQVEL